MRFHIYISNVSCDLLELKSLEEAMLKQRLMQIG